MANSYDREDRADEIDMCTFAATTATAFDQSAMEDLEEDFMFRDGWPGSKAKRRPKTKLRLCRGCNTKKPANDFRVRGRLHRCKECLP